MRLVILGAGGHARVVLDAARTMTGVEIVGLVGTDRDRGPIDGAPIVGTDADLLALRAKGATHAVVAVGSIEPGPLRAALFERIRAAGLEAAVVVHRDATVSPTASVGEGSVVFAGAVVNAGARVGRNAIVNTAAVVEHDCVVGDHAHVSPGAVLGGATRVGAGAHVGIGATVIQGLVIGSGAFVAAGAVVIADVADGTRVAGVPARPMG
jgi:sugar O-acyltransferase (sialic acid O-acetyltransferase NeuD family)